MIFLLLVGVKFGFHEQWKDEWQAWFLARDLSVTDLLSFLYYEGHPALWYLWLKPFSILLPTGDLGLKLAHVIIFTGFIYAWFRSDLPAWVKIAGLLTYPFFFEYGVVSRSYVLILLLAFFWSFGRNIRPGLIPFLLFFLCQTAIQGVFVAFAIMVYHFFEKGWGKDFLQIATGAFIGLVAFVITVYPRDQREDLSFAYSASPDTLESWWAAFQGTTANVFFMGFLPDTNVFGLSVLGLFLGLLALALCILLLRSSRNALILFIAYWIPTFLFHAIIYNGGLRQWSMVFVVFILALSVAPNVLKSRKNLLIAVALFLGPLYYNGRAIVKEVTMPFSNSQITGDFIKERVPEGVPVVAINKFECSPVGGYAERAFYALPDGLPFTYFKWVEKIYIPTEAELRLFIDYKGVGGLVVISPVELDRARFPGLQEWQRFDQPNIKGENYILYTLKKDENSIGNQRVFPGG